MLSDGALLSQHAGKLRGYAADVFEFEDWALPDRPLSICPELLNAPRTLFAPHLGESARCVSLSGGAFVGLT